MSRPRAVAAEGPGAGVPPPVTPDIAAEAAVWVARLHGPDRSRRMEHECLAWQARSAAHREAFERCTETWQDVPRVTLASAYAAASSRDRASEAGRRSGIAPAWRWASAFAIAGLVLGGIAAFQIWRDAGVYGTGVGEQQLVVLDDGTRMSLNTATRVKVVLDDGQRTVSVERGEALFDVARDARRPFVVRAAGTEVTAIGTVFAVRFNGRDASAADALAVTLVEGEVIVRKAGDARGLAPAQPVRMQAGDRVRLVAGDGPSVGPVAARVDRPDIDRMMAWRRSEAVFDDTTLADAVAEMNRYSRTPIVLVDASRWAELRVSGQYRTGDSTGFAGAVAALHGLHLREHDGRLELTRPQ